MSVQKIQTEIVKGIKRTATAIQNDTLDNIAHRYFGSMSNAYLSVLIELNPDLAPTAIIPMGYKVILPDSDEVTTTPTLKLWD